MHQSNGRTTLLALPIVRRVGPTHGSKSTPPWVHRVSMLAATLGFFMLCLTGSL